MSDELANILGNRLTRLFAQAETDRRDIEQRWLRDLRQYKGQYDPDVLSRLHPARSKAFVRLTRAKVRTVDARLTDLLFPGGSEDNWSIEPTPVPEPGWLNMDGAKRACTAMAREIRDQLTEANYREIMREVIHSGNLYGTGVLKGPLVEYRNQPGWTWNGKDWQLTLNEVMQPYLEFVPLWDIYPDLGARSIEDCRYVFQRHVLSKSELGSLQHRPDFDSATVRTVLQDNPNGVVDGRSHEQELRQMGEQAGLGGQVAYGADDNRFEVLEFWGWVDGADLAACGMPLNECGELPSEREFAANIWLCNGRVLKAVLAPLQGASWPYYFYYFDKDETSLFGEGLASIMRDPQQLFNASLRAMLDNAAICAGPQLEVNQDLLPEGEDPTDVYPFRVWLRSGAGIDAQYPAVRVSTLPSHTEEFMAMCRLFETLIHETTGMPAALSAENAKGAGNTVRGLSMLMGQASITLKDQIKHFDDGITRPFIRALYHWNMRFNPKMEIKGDFNVQARGLSSLVARELYVDQLDAFARATSNSLDAPWINRGELLRRMAQARDLGDGVVRTDEQMQQLEQERLQ